MKRISLCIITLLLIIGNIFSIIADDNVPVTYIKSTYSKNVSPQKDDKFVIKYKKKDGNQTAQIELDASTIISNPGTMKLPVADYEIIDIEYTGNNEEIVKEGYAITSDFSVHNDSSAYIYMSIGSETCDVLIKEHMNVIVKDDRHERNGVLKETQENTEELQTTSSDKTTDMRENATDQNITEYKSLNSKPKVVHYNHPKSQQDLTNVGTKLIPLCILFVLGLLTIFILHKKKKI